MRINSVEKTSFKSQIYFDNKTKRSWNKHSFWPNFVEMVQKRDETARLEDFLKNKITQNGDDNYLVIEEFKRKRKERPEYIIALYDNIDDILLDRKEKCLMPKRSINQWGIKIDSKSGNIGNPWRYSIKNSSWLFTDLYKTIWAVLEKLGTPNGYIDLLKDQSYAPADTYLKHLTSQASQVASNVSPKFRKMSVFEALKTLLKH